MKNETCKHISVKSLEYAETLRELRISLNFLPLKPRKNIGEQPCVNQQSWKHLCMAVTRFSVEGIKEKI